MTVSNRVLNSVLTQLAVISPPAESRCGEGSSGERSAMYLLPNTVLALMSALTFAGMR